jgi:hypothetical protein
VITYDDLTLYAPPAASKDERDAWFTSHGYSADDLIRVGREVAEWRLADLTDGDKLSSDELLLALVLAVTFGFELAVRCERGEKPDLTPPTNGPLQ